jgi:hypothetical protein
MLGGDWNEGEFNEFNKEDRERWGGVVSCVR